MSTLKRVNSSDIPATALSNGSWSRMLITRDTTYGNQSSLGVSTFTPGTVSAAIAHDVEELIFVCRGRGELCGDEEALSFAPGDALFVPPHVWHWVANTGSEDVEMIFSFPFPGYPPTKRR